LVCKNGNNNYKDYYSPFITIRNRLCNLGEELIMETEFEKTIGGRLERIEKSLKKLEEEKQERPKIDDYIDMRDKETDDKENLMSGIPSPDDFKKAIGF